MASSSKHNKISPEEFELAARLGYPCAASGLQVPNSSPEAIAIQTTHDHISTGNKSNNAYKGNSAAHSSRSSLAKLRALRDDDDDDDCNNNDVPLNTVVGSLKVRVRYS